MLWECPGCFAVRECDPPGHTDYGGVVRLSPPRCPECDELMDYAGEGEEGE